MNRKIPNIHKGLEGVYVDTTKICQIDGANGVLTYRGKKIEELSEKSFPYVFHLLLTGVGPTPEEEKLLDQFLSNHFYLNEGQLNILNKISKGIHPMKVIQGMIPLIPWDEKVCSIQTFQNNPEKSKAAFYCAKIAAIISGHYRQSLRKPIVPTKKWMSFLENFLYTFTGKAPSKSALSVFRIVQILQMEHSLNASTFAGKVTASTLAPLEVALSTAIGTLFGPLHGGADQAALEMALEIKDVKLVEQYVLGKLEKKEKIMGVGHRVYKVVDPRANILKPLAIDLCSGTPFENTLKILLKIEDVVDNKLSRPDRPIKANVEFYKGIVFYALGIPPRYFTSLFAFARSCGYAAHIIEGRQDNKLIRPLAFYTGPKLNSV